MQSCISNACVLRACLRKKNKLSDCKTPDDIQGFVANHKTSIWEGSLTKRVCLQLDRARGYIDKECIISYGRHWTNEMSTESWNMCRTWDKCWGPESVTEWSHIYTVFQQSLEANAVNANYGWSSLISFLRLFDNSNEIPGLSTNAVVHCRSSSLPKILARHPTLPGWGCSSVTGASDRYAAEAGSIPRCGKGFLSQSQVSTADSLTMSVHPRVQPHALTSVRTFKIL